jgi:hypothetical protein
MKNLYTFFFCFLTFVTAQSQTFEFSLAFVDTNPNTGNYQMALLATPSSSVTNGNTADMGAGFYVPAGMTLGNFVTGNSGLPASEWSSLTMGTTKPQGDPYFLARIEAVANSILLNGPGPFELVLFDVIADPNPTSGEIIFVENGDPVFNELLFIENYININLGSGTSNYYSQNNPLDSSINFATLSVPSQVLDESSIIVYPNPTKGMLYLGGDVAKLKEVNVYSISGQQVMFVSEEELLSGSIINGQSTIDLSKLTSGIYFIHLSNDSHTTIKKIIKD